MGMDPVTIALLAGAGATTGAALLDNKNQKKAITSAENQKALSQAFIKQQMEQARGDLFKLFPSAQDSQKQGLQAGMDLYAQTVPYQLNAFNQGNLNAQNTLLQGLPQIQNAILGRPMNTSGLQAKAPLQDLRMPNSPNFQPINGLAGAQQ